MTPDEARAHCIGLDDDDLVAMIVEGFGVLTDRLGQKPASAWLSLVLASTLDERVVDGLRVWTTAAGLR